MTKTHWLTDYLLTALQVEDGLPSRKAIAKRISKLVKKPIALHQVDDVLAHVRHWGEHDPEYYGFQIPKVRRGIDGRGTDGAMGTHRYFLVMWDPKDERWTTQPGQETYLRLGATSSFHASLTEAERCASAIEAFAITGDATAPGKRELRAASAASVAAVKLLMDALSKVA